MRKGTYLGQFELMVLLALMRLEDDAYGVTIAEELERQTGREVVVASVYATLERLQERGLVSSSLGDATPERGGRAKRYVRITGAGLREVRDARQSLGSRKLRLCNRVVRPNRDQRTHAAHRPP